MTHPHPTGVAWHTNKVHNTVRILLRFPNVLLYMVLYVIKYVFMLSVALFGILLCPYVLGTVNLYLSEITLNGSTASFFLASLIMLPVSIFILPYYIRWVSHIRQIVGREWWNDCANYTCWTHSH
jgi:hypothetical protein